MVERGRPREFDRSVALRRAMEVFWRRGYEGASLADLKAAMNINAPSLYAAFGSKEALFREAVALYESAECREAARALDEAPTARAAVEALLRSSADAYACPEKPAGCMIVLAGANCSKENDGVREFLAELRRRGREKLERRIASGIRAGELPRGADAAALAAYYTAVLEGLSIQARDGATRKRLHQIVDCAMAGWDAMVDRQPRRARATGSRNARPRGSNA